MTANQVLETLDIYRQKLRELGVPPEEIDQSSEDHNSLEELKHCHYMIIETEELVRDGRMEKAFRWLGFLQCIFWTSKIYTITELKKHNLPQVH